ncbi:hypothetical protein BD414DRAFT_526398 [Trametes punicea]|nr:hypothetical protein BD414DRAFT_526398 [Trametes punicea]
MPKHRRHGAVYSSASESYTKAAYSSGVRELMWQRAPALDPSVQIGISNEPPELCLSASVLVPQSPGRGRIEEMSPSPPHFDTSLGFWPGATHSIRAALLSRIGDNKTWVVTADFTPLRRVSAHAGCRRSDRRGRHYSEQEPSSRTASERRREPGFYADTGTANLMCPERPDLREAWGACQWVVGACPSQRLGLRAQLVLHEPALSTYSIYHLQRLIKGSIRATERLGSA